MEDATVTTFIYLMAVFGILNAIFSAYQNFELIRNKCCSIKAKNSDDVLAEMGMMHEDLKQEFQDLRGSIKNNSRVLRGLDGIRKKLAVVEEESALKFIRVPRLITSISKQIRTIRKQGDAILQAVVIQQHSDVDQNSQTMTPTMMYRSPMVHKIVGTLSESSPSTTDS